MANHACLGRCRCFSAHRGWKVRDFTKPVAEFGECVLYGPAMSIGKDKFDGRWKERVWLGCRMESGESWIGTDEGVAKARDFRRKAGNGRRWSVIDFEKLWGYLGSRIQEQEEGLN